MDNTYKTRNLITNIILYMQTIFFAMMFYVYNDTIGKSLVEFGRTLSYFK